VIDWGAFGLVALVSLVAAAALVTLYAAGLRLMTWSHAGSSLPRTKRVGAIVCFAACGVLVLFGIYLIVPALHGG
jgi:hypothetical protein